MLVLKCTKVMMAIIMLSGVLFMGSIGLVFADNAEINSSIELGDNLSFIKNKTIGAGQVLEIVKRVIGNVKPQFPDVEIPTIKLPINEMPQR
jgi:hypothetical protein